MYKLITIILFSLLSTNLFAQNEDSLFVSEEKTYEYEIIDEYPSYVKKDGEIIGVIFTVEQAQKIDSYIELLDLFKKLNIQDSKIEEFYISIINDQNEKILTYELKVDEFKSKLIDKEMIIKELEYQISKQKEFNIKTEEQRQNDTEIIEELKKELTKEKTKKIVGISTSTTIGAALLALTIYLGIR
jgi:gamma-glutamylcyclotransferase (GGCT)/AIG2-like uncharacterized protein YtfP